MQVLGIGQWKVKIKQYLQSASVLSANPDQIVRKLLHLVQFREVVEIDEVTVKCYFQHQLQFKREFFILFDFVKSHLKLSNTAAEAMN